MNIFFKPNCKTNSLSTLTLFKFCQKKRAYKMCPDSDLIENKDIVKDSVLNPSGTVDISEFYQIFCHCFALSSCKQSKEHLFPSFCLNITFTVIA